MAGLQYGWVKTEVEITGVGSGEDTADIVDGIVALRPNVRLMERWHFNPTFLVGAGDSELTWEVQPTIVYRINEDLALRAGYRRVFYDTEGNRGNGFELAFQGLLVGVDLLFYPHPSHLRRDEKSQVVDGRASWTHVFMDG